MRHEAAPLSLFSVIIAEDSTPLGPSRVEVAWVVVVVVEDVAADVNVGVFKRRRVVQPAMTMMRRGHTICEMTALFMGRPHIS
jgi:hypothetical protein